MLNSDLFTHSLFVSQKAKDAIVDRFRERTGKRPDVDLIFPAFKLYIHVFKNEVTILLEATNPTSESAGNITELNDNVKVASTDLGKTTYEKDLIKANAGKILNTKTLNTKVFHVIIYAFRNKTNLDNVIRSLSEKGIEVKV